VAAILAASWLDVSHQPADKHVTFGCEAGSTYMNAQGRSDRRGRAKAA
jgi:hypothetical protein